MTPTQIAEAQRMVRMEADEIAKRRRQHMIRIAITTLTVPTIDLTAGELAAVAAAIRRAIEDDKFPHAPRLDPLRAALARLDAALALEPTPAPKAPAPAQAAAITPRQRFA
jgi:hypothetical protein